MLKINFFSIILITTLLSACGFHTPHQEVALNAKIIAKAHNPFAIAFKKHLNPNIAQSLTLQIGDEIFKKQTASYKSNGEINSYNLNLSVPIQVFDRNKKRLFIDTLTAKSHIKRIIATQAHRLQIEENHQQLRDSLVKKLLRILKKL